MTASLILSQRGCQPSISLQDEHVERAYDEVIDELQDGTAMDWSSCALVEVVPGKVSGVPILKGTRMPAGAVLENYLSGSPPEEIAENFEIPERSVRAVLAYAVERDPTLKP